MGNDRDKDIKISYEDLVHPLIKNRIVLDYPLDVLLNRECLLQDYENRVIRSLKEYNIEKDKFWLWYKDLNKNEEDGILRKKTLYKIIIILRMFLYNEDSKNILQIIKEKKLNCENINDCIDIIRKDKNIESLFTRIENLSSNNETAKTDDKIISDIYKYIKQSDFDLKGIASTLNEIESENNIILCYCNHTTLILFNKIIEYIIKWPDINNSVNTIPDIKEFLLKLLSVYQVSKGKIGSLTIRSIQDEFESNNFSEITEHEQIGSGNILIKGRPGSGKSTLALQMAVACTYEPNRYSSIYISLEESIKNIMLKAKAFNWDEQLCQMKFLNDIDDLSSPEEIGQAMKHVLTQPQRCQFRNKNADKTENVCEEHEKRIDSFELVKPCVLLPLLSPRSLTQNESSNDDLFWERFKQLERLLTGIAYMRESQNKIIPDIRMVCIDSLNVFGNKPLSRSELFKLFDLFKSKGVIGVFTSEQDSKIIDMPVGEQIEDYLADIIIQLHMEEDNGYANRYFEVVKSRYQHQVYGLHPMRLRGLETQNLFRKQWRNVSDICEEVKTLLMKTETTDFDEKKDELNGYIDKLKTEDNISIDSDMRHNYYQKIQSYYYSKLIYSENEGDDKNEKEIKNNIKRILTTRHNFFQPVIIHPSLHYVVYSTEMQSLSEGSEEHGKKFDIGSKNLQNYLKHNVKQKKGSIVTIRGPRATFKTNIAQNFLIDGILKNENVLLITLGEQQSVKLNADEILNWSVCMESDNNDDKIGKIREIEEMKFKELKAHSLEDPKRIMKIYKKSNEAGCRLTELTLKGGALLPEEFLEFIRDIFREYHHSNQITRVVFDDVSLIGSSYPFLRKSKTSGDLFLSAFVHVMKNYKVNLLINGTTGQMAESDEMVNRASELADSVLTCEFCDVFGKRYVTISGDGMHSMSNESKGRDYVPAVVMLPETDNGKPGELNRKVNDFEIDTSILEGLVGFGTPHIYRPGLRLYTFKEGKILDDYNKELEAMLGSSLGISWREPFDNTDEKESVQINQKGVIAHSPLNNQDISVVSFDSSMSGALHDSLDIIEKRPIDSTVVYTIDELWLCPDPKKGNNDEIEQIKKSFCDLDDIKKSQEENISDNYRLADKIHQVVPYYGNVLLIAYRKDFCGLEDLGKTVEGKFKTTWEQINSIISKSNKITEIDMNQDKSSISNKILTPCLIDSSAPETISCVMLDLFSDNIFNQNNSIVKPNISFHIEEQKIEDFMALHEIMSCSYHDSEKIKNSKLFKPHSKSNTLYPCAGIYICWYSQLREMISEYPFLANKLNVCSLPGGGIKGDWYLGVAKGSVSKELGKRVINILTSKKEQYKRFALGVGLPTHKNFYDKNNDDEFFAWPHGSIGLRKIENIHANAKSRMTLPGYKEYRTMLYTIGKQLISTNQSENLEKNDVRELIKRINFQYDILKQSEEKQFR